MVFTLVKTVHILMAITAVGFNFSYGFWTARAAREPEHLAYTLKTLLVLDRIANAGYGLLLLTGLLMVVVGGLDFKTLWIAAAIVLYIVAVVIASAFYTPTLRRQVEALERSGPASSEYAAAARLATAFGAAVMVPVLAIVLLMVFKPTHLF